MRPQLRLAALALAAGVACREEPRPPPPAAAPARRAAPAAFSVRDLALATALDARLAALTLVGSDVRALLERGRAGEAGPLLARLRVARAEVEQAASAVSNPADGRLAARAGALAGRYADELVAAAAGAPLSGALARAQGELGQAIEGYRRARAAWRLEGFPAQGAEREFDEARRELERLEAAPAVAAAEVAHASGRAAAAAARLSPALRAPAERWSAAQGKALAALRSLSAAADARRAAEAARAHHAAKAEALAALADYWAALASR